MYWIWNYKYRVIHASSQTSSTVPGLQTAFLRRNWGGGVIHSWQGFCWHTDVHLMQYSLKWCTITSVNTLPWCTRTGVFNFFTTTQEHIPLKVKYRTMFKFTPVGPKTVWWDPCSSNLPIIINYLLLLLLLFICNQLSNIPYIFVHCDLLELNKIHEKKLQVINRLILFQIVTLKA